MKFAESMLRLYAVTDRSWVGTQALYEQVEAALRGGVTCVQLREKELNDTDFLAEAKELKILCARYGVPLIINDNVELALKVDADGVHVGQEDMDARDVRGLIGPAKVLGVTAMQKMLGKSRFEELLAPYIEKPQGKPTLVPESDKRPAMNTAKNDFMEEF